MRQDSWRETALVAVTFLALSVLVTLPVTLDATTRIAGDRGDPWGNAWTLAWGGERLAHMLRGFWQTPTFYPYTSGAAFSEPLLGVTVVVAPLQWIWHNPALTYNSAFLLSFALTGLLTFVLVRRLTGSAPAAFVAGCAVAFSPYRTSQLGHLQVLSVWWMPLAFLFLHDLLQRGRALSALLFAATFVLQSLANGYSFFFMLAGSAAIVVVSMLSGEMSRRQTLILGTAAIAGALVLLPLAARFNGVWGGRPPELGVMAAASADLSSLLQVRDTSMWARWLPAGNPETDLFPGLAIALLACIGLLAPGEHRRVRRVYAIVGIVGLLLAMGPLPRAWGQPLAPVGPYALFARIVPLSNIMRVPARFWMLTVLALGVLSALGAHRLLRGRPARTQWRLAVLAGAVIAAEASAAPLRMVPLPDTDRPEYNWLAAQPSGALLELPIAYLGKSHDGMRAQYASLRHAHRIVNGISRVTPPLIVLLDWSASPLADSRTVHLALPLLSELHVRYVFVRPERYTDPGLAQATIDAFMQDAIYVEAALRLGDGFMFTIRPSETPVPPAAQLQRLPASAMTASASRRPERAAAVLDGDRRTGWVSDPQVGGEWFSLTFDRPRDVAVLRIAMGNLADYPRDLEVVGVVDGRPGPTLFRGSVLGALGSAIRLEPDDPEVALVLPVNHVDGLLLRQYGNGGIWSWSMTEVAIDTRSDDGAGSMSR